MNRRKIAALIMVAVIMAAVGMYAGCSHASDVSVDDAGGPDDFKIDFPSVAGPSGEPTFELAADLPSVDSMTVYRVENPVITADYVEEIGSRLGFEGPAGLIEGGTNFSMVDRGAGEIRQLRVWVDSGAIEYIVLEPDILYPPYRPSLPSAAEAKRISFEFLSKTGLLPADYGEPTMVDHVEVKIGGSYGIGTKVTGEVLEEYTTHLLVSFPRQIGGFRVVGPGAKFGVRICDNGEVGKFLGVWREVSPYEELAIKPAEEAYQDLVTGNVYIYAPVDCETVVVDDVSLAYWMESLNERQDYVVPVYEFKGKCLDEDGEYIEDFCGWSEALQ